MISLAQRLFFRLLRHGEFHLLLSALVIATASITAISLFIERIENTLYDEASHFIAADAKIQGSLVIPEDFLEEAAERSLHDAQYKAFNAMLIANDEMRLSRVKAVDDRYPLKGVLEVQHEIGLTTETSHGPGPGEIWLAPRLLTMMGLSLGDTVDLGRAKFDVTGVLIKEPDDASTRFGLAPRVMMHISDIDQTGALQIGSRVEHALLLAGEPENVRKFKDFVEAKLGEHFRWLSPEDGSRAVGSAIDRAERFLLLAGSLSVILSGLAIAIAAQFFARKQQSQVALLKSLGVKPSQIQNLYATMLGILALLGAAIGTFVGWSLHHIIIFLLRDVIPANLAAATLPALFLGALTCLLTLAAFAGPPLMSLKHVSPIQILRQQTGSTLAIRASVLIGLLAIMVLIFYYSRDIMISGILFAALCACVVLSAVCAWGMLNITKKLQQTMHGYWRIGFANLQRQRGFTGLQIFVFASIGLLMIVLVQVRTELIETWKPAAESAPNHFAINIFADELQSVKQRFADASIEVSAFYPMSRGRLVQVGEQSIDTLINEEINSNDYERELNLTWSQTMGEDNAIVTGAWWEESPTLDTLLVSAEEQYAEGLGLKIGDTLTFSIAGQTISAELASIRSVQWDSMNPNFYMIFNQPIADNVAANWITSFHLSADEKPFLIDFIKEYPTISVIELDQTLDLVKQVAQRVSMAVEFIMALVLCSSLLVILTSIKATIGERLRESALIRSFGAPRRFVLNIILVEFAAVGLLAGLFASAGASLSLYFIQTRLFDMPYQFSWELWLIAPVISTALVALAGYGATLSTIKVPPIQALRSDQ